MLENWPPVRSRSGSEIGSPNRESSTIADDLLISDNSDDEEDKLPSKYVQYPIPLHTNYYSPSPPIRKKVRLFLILFSGTTIDSSLRIANLESNVAELQKCCRALSRKVSLIENKRKKKISRKQKETKENPSGNEAEAAV